jgi:hypothetical protein
MTRQEVHLLGARAALTGVAIGARIKVVFSRSADPATIDATTVLVDGVAGAVTSRGGLGRRGWRPRSGSPPLRGAPAAAAARSRAEELLIDELAELEFGPRSSTLTP